MCRRTFRKSFSILFRARFDVSPPDICWRRFFVFFLKTKQNKQKKMLGQLFSTEYHLLIATEPLMEVWYLLITEKFLFLNFGGGEGGEGGGGEYRLFLRQKVDGKMIFTGHWKVLVLNFLGMRNAVFIWGKMLMERWYLLVTERFLFSAFSVIRNTVSILAKKSF